jgi:tetratricopeptide (TPR) repeat protein
MGEIHRSQGKWETALANYQEAVRLDPRNVRRLNELAETYSAMRRFDEAQDTWARSIEISEFCFPYYRLSGDVFRATGDLARAREVMEQCPANPDSYYYLFGNGILRLYDRDWAAAREWFAQVKAEGPFMVGVRSILLATVEYYENERAGDLPRARECVAQMEAFLIDSPGAADQRSWLSLCHAFLGNAAAAQREAKLAVDLTAADLAAGPKMLNTLATIYALTGKPDEAWEILERILEAHYPEPLTRHELRLDPLYDPFRSDPRFQALVKGGE